MSALEFIKSHPYETAGGIFVVGAIAIVVLKKGSGSNSGAISSGVDPNAAAVYSAQMQLEQAQMQQQGQLAAITAQGNTQTTLANLSAQVAALQSNNALTLGLNTNSTGATINQQNTGTQLAVTNSNNAAAVDTTALVTQAQLETAKAADATAYQTALAADNTSAALSLYSNETQQQLGQYQAQAFQTMANANVQMASISAKTARSNSTNSLLGQVVGTAGMLALAL